MESIDPNTEMLPIRSYPEKQIIHDSNFPRIKKVIKSNIP